MADPFIAEAQDRVKVTVVHPVTFTEFRASRYGDLGVQVRGVFSAHGGTPWPLDIEVQFKPNGPSEWSTVSTLSGSTQFETITPEQRPGRWRAHYAGVSNLFEKATSQVVVVK
ncbi:hypothetical protein V5P93_003498 [Actinokineospora auranticolor]|uniref:Uncharacterized protein n=1 Tax=Actinokineospora auranticolor TaxID=155976 RepID=A0A2S6GPV9_9PSEU|nr:hypothetical protein [Actinokineospora auranticolor]PPK67161.1 hypothetical protein CLV40_108158 [Actinokineospora auranticolor]